MAHLPCSLLLKSLSVSWTSKDLVQLDRNQAVGPTVGSDSRILRIRFSVVEACLIEKASHSSYSNFLLD